MHATSMPPTLPDDMISPLPIFAAFVMHYVCLHGELAGPNTLSLAKYMNPSGW